MKRLKAIAFFAVILLGGIGTVDSLYDDSQDKASLYIAEDIDDDLENSEIKQEIESLINNIMRVGISKVSGNILAQVYSLKAKKIVDSIVSCQSIDSVLDDRVRRASRYLDKMINGFPNMNSYWNYKALYKKAHLMAHLGRFNEAIVLLNRILSDDCYGVCENTLRKASVLLIHCLDASGERGRSEMGR